jgi:gliding motility-associated-like protein
MITRKISRFASILSLLFCLCGLNSLAQPCLPNWAYRVPITITNSSASVLTDFQVVSSLNTSTLLLNGKIRSDGGDIRVLTNSGSSLSHWIETGTFNTAATRIWVKVPSIPANGSATVYLFYGNPSASSASNGNTVFELFDDFAGASVDLSKWVACGAGTTAVSGGQISLTGPAFLTSFNTVGSPVKINVSVSDYDLGTSGTSFVGLINNGTQTGYMAGVRNVAATARIVQRRIQPPGTCYTFDTETLSASTIAPIGLWEFAWPAGGQQAMNMDGVNFGATDGTVSPIANQKVVFGNIDMAGPFAIDFLFARKYHIVDPIASLGTELNVNVPPLTATNSGRSCQGQDVGLSVTDVPGANYSWVNAANQVVGLIREPILTSATPAANGLYTVTVSVPGGCSSSTAETTVQIDATTVSGTAGNDNVVCYAQNAGSINLTGNTGNIVRWESSQTGADPWSAINNTTTVLNYTNLISTVYYRAVVKNGVCLETESNAVKVAVDPTTITGEISGTSEVCDVENSANLRLAGRTGDIVRWESSLNGTTWIGIANTTQQLALNDLTITTNYRTVVKSGVCPQKFSEPYTVTVNPLPQPSFTTVAVCEGEIMSFSNTSAINSGSIVSLLWEFGDGSSAASSNPKHVYVNSGDQQVTLTTTSNAGCTKAVTLPVTVHAKPVITFTAPQTCDGFPTAFQNQSAIASGTIATFSWDFGDGTGSSEVNPIKQYFNAGTFLVTLKAVSNNTCSSSLSKNITIDQLPVTNFTADEVCLGQNTQFRNSSFYNAGQLTYEWAFGDGSSAVAMSPSHAYGAAGIYQVKLIATTDRGCQDSVSRSVSVRTLVGGTAGPDVSVSKGLGVQLVASGGISFLWTPAESLSNPAIANPIATPVATTNYLVTITDQLGCQATDEVTVSVIDDFTVTAMNVLTPNGDGVNDSWTISNIGNYGDANVSVYDRNGKKVFGAQGYQNDWQGTAGTDLLPDGTYYYVIQFANADVAYTGSLTILRNN